MVVTSDSVKDGVEGSDSSSGVSLSDIAKMLTAMQMQLTQQQGKIEALEVKNSSEPAQGEKPKSEGVNTETEPSESVEDDNHDLESMAPSVSTGTNQGVASNNYALIVKGGASLGTKELEIIVGHGNKKEVAAFKKVQQEVSRLRGRSEMRLRKWNKQIEDTENPEMLKCILDSINSDEIKKAQDMLEITWYELEEKAMDMIIYSKNQEEIDEILLWAKEEQHRQTTRILEDRLAVKAKLEEKMCKLNIATKVDKDLGDIRSDLIPENLDENANLLEAEEWWDSVDKYIVNCHGSQYNFVSKWQEIVKQKIPKEWYARDQYKYDTAKTSKEVKSLLFNTLALKNPLWLSRADFFQQEKKKDTRLTVHMEEKKKMFKASRMEELLELGCSDCTKCDSCTKRLHDRIIACVTIGTAKKDSVTEKVIKHNVDSERKGEQLSTDKIRTIAEKEEALQFTKEKIDKVKPGRGRRVNLLFKRYVHSKE